MYCESCGQRLAEGAKFCRNCGAPVMLDSEETATWPGAKDAPTAVSASAPPPRHVQAAGPHAGRPGWVLPTVALTVLLVIGIAVAIVLVSRDGSSQSGTQNLSNALAPVISADRILEGRLGSITGARQLASVREAADTLASAVTRAQGAVDATNAGANAKSEVADALAANLDYAHKVRTAAANLTVITASGARDSAQQVIEAYAAVTTRDPDVATPKATAFLSVQQLGTLATEIGRQRTTHDTATAAIRSYVRSIDGLLRNSVATRADLGSLIIEAESGSIGSGEARDRIAGVIAQRTSLETQVAALNAPTPFSGVAELLRKSIAASLDDDRAIQGLINAYLDNSDPSAFAAQHESANRQATDEKRAFLTAYNRLRRRYLRLAPLSLDLHY